MLNISPRFVTARKYRTFVLFDENGRGHDAILGYYCSCKNGLRTVGCCSHTMTVIYYLGFAQYNGGVKEPSQHSRDVFKRQQNDDGEHDTDDDVEHDTDNEELFEYDEADDEYLTAV